MERRRFPDETDEARIDPAELGVIETSEGPSLLEEDLFAHADPRIFVTDPERSPAGSNGSRGDTGAVEFSPVAEDEDELREWLSERGLEITEIDVDNEFARSVREEFLEQTPLYPEAPELSDQESPAER